MKEKKQFLGTEKELMFICTIICDCYVDELMGITGRYTMTAEMVSEATRAFFKTRTLAMDLNNTDVDDYVNMIIDFGKKYIKENYGLILTEFVKHDSE